MGIPRARLALRRLAAAGLPHVAVCDMPTTGGIWISVGGSADVRAGVTGATVGFVGPRVVEAITGRPVSPGSFTAEAAYAGGRLEALLAGDEVGGWLARVLDALAPGTGEAGVGAAGGPVQTAAPPVELPDRTGAEQVRAARARRTSGSTLLYGLFPNAVDLRAGHRDTTVRAVVGRLADDEAPVVGVALAADHDGRPTVDGYALLTRAATLADRVGIRLLTLVDTPGAEPDARSEADGITPAIATALDAVLTCRAPTVALVHGEGGSGGAMAAAVTDIVLVTPDAYFSALGPEGAAAALRIPPAEAAERMRVVPRDLLALGFADAAVPPPDSAHPETLRRLLGTHFARLGALSDDERCGRRRQRWSAALPGTL